MRLSLKMLFFIQDVVRKIENTNKGPNDKPVEDVVIAKAGSIPVDTPFTVTNEESKD